MTISNCIIIMLYAFPDGDILLQENELIEITYGYEITEDCCFVQRPLRDTEYIANITPAATSCHVNFLSFCHVCHVVGPLSV